MLNQTHIILYKLNHSYRFIIVLTIRQIKIKPKLFLVTYYSRRINDKDVSFILETIKEIPEAEFKGFNFAYNQITDEGITAISTFVQASILNSFIGTYNFLAVYTDLSYHL